MSMLDVPPAAADPETSLERFIEELEDELPPAAAPESIELEVPVCGQEQLDTLGVEPPLTAEPDVVELLEGEVLVDEDDGNELLPEGSVLLPLAALEPEPVVDDWLVCAPWFIVEDGLVVVALWLAETPLEVFWSPLPMFTPGLMFAPALTSVLLIPTLASTPTFGFTLTPVLVEDEVVEDGLVVLVWA